VKGVWLVVGWEYLTRIRSKYFVISLVLMPLIMGAIILIPAMLMESAPEEGLTIAIIDESGRWEDPITAMLDQLYQSADGAPEYPRYALSRTGIVSPQEDAAALLEAGVIDCYLVIKADFETARQVEYYADGLSGILGREQIRRAVNRAWTNHVLGQASVPARVQQMLAEGIRWKDYKSASGKEASGLDVLTFLKPMLFLIVFFMVIMFTSQTLMRSVIAERGNRMAEILLSSVSAEDLMTGKILGIGLVGLTQLSTYIILALLIRRGTGEALITLEGAGFYLLYAVVGYFFFAAIYGGVGALFENEQEAQQVIGPLAILLVLPLAFSTFVITRPDALMVRLLSHFPPFTPFMMILRINVTPVPWWEIASTLLILVVSTWLMLRWAGIIFRTAILMYGQRVTLPEIIRWLRA